MTEAPPGAAAGAFAVVADVVLGAFGADRVMFGSDWPVCLLASDYAGVMALARSLTAGLSAAERAAVFGGTAARAYRLGGTGAGPRPGSRGRGAERNGSGGGAVALTDEAIGKIKEMIISGRVRPGEKLPREADLAAELGLSRNSLREAVKALTLVNVLDVRQGDGTYATSLAPSLLLEALSFIIDFHRDDTVLEFFEVRRILEPAATGARRAADVGAGQGRARQDPGRRRGGLPGRRLRRHRPGVPQEDRPRRGQLGAGLAGRQHVAADGRAPGSGAA